MIKLVVRRLRCHDSAKVSFPSPEKMQQFASMVNNREPAISDVIGFMDGVSFKSECTSERITQNAFYCGYDCDTTVNNVFAYGPDGLNYPGSWADSSLTARFLPHIKRGLVTSKYVLTRDFQGVGQLTMFGLDPSMIALHEDFIPMCVIICCVSVMCTHHFARPVSGVCVECRVLFLVARNDYQVIISTEDLYWNP
jgi:hypothetical protein